jgi:hypothetical protein
LIGPNIGARKPDDAVTERHAAKHRTTRSQQGRLLFDHLVGKGNERRRQRNSERPCGALIDRQTELVRLIDWEVAGLGTLDDLRASWPGWPKVETPPSTSADALKKAGMAVTSTALAGTKFLLPPAVS